ncbi:hypothetical protein C6A37_04440 [Desulfobacteraceae bacterium SEEP-SAG9]|nr:hypothetical protein C6A37_04440 [Desulfobacteraceae bacterium SEEP-SAG9]
MSKSLVAIVRYDKPLESVRKAVELSRGLDHLPSRAKVFIKPNIVFWTRAVTFPKWGVITTSRVVEDMIILLKERGIDDITIGEGTVLMDIKDTQTSTHAFQTLGYGVLKQRYGIKYLNVFERPFEKVDLCDGVKLNFNSDILNSDFVVDLPVLKTHSNTVVSLGIKNLKGMIDIPSRKKCHNMTPGKDLHFWIAKLADKMPPMFTLLDGIYTNERGPGFDGRLRRSNLLVASADVLSADMVGARVLGHEPSQVPHLAHAAKNAGRPLDLGDIEIVGEAVDDVARLHEYDFQYSETDEGIIPVPLAKQGIKGVYYRKYDLSLCTYCAFANGLMLGAIRYAWKGEPWDQVEVLTGKAMQPTPGMKKTILLGKCIYQAHKNNPDIQEMIAVKGCPPKPQSMVKALHQAGIDADPSLFENMDQLPGFFMSRYEGKPEFDEKFFMIE